MILRMMDILKHIEIYGIPLKAKMVVLSSCNTGTGCYIQVKAF